MLFVKNYYNTYKFILLLSTTILFWGCDTASNYKTLSYFFDGVPNPDSVAINSVDSNSKSNIQNQNISHNTIQLHSHKPYTSRECSKCHQSSFSNKLVKDINDLCFDCHAELIKDSIYVHGPVAEGYCVKCHQPHTSTNDNLILKTDQSLCYECHLKTDILKNKAHYEIKDTICWVCHNPHAQSKQYFLKN